MEDRKKRLAALAARAGRSKAPVQDENEDPSTEPTTTTAELKFRNYTPSDPSLEQASNKRARQDEEGETAAEEPVPKKSVLEEALEKAKKDLEEAGDSIPTDNSAELTAMAPKKVNWDLKRDIQAKLDKLEKRTQKVLIQLLRERLSKEADAAAEEDGEEENDELD